MLLLSELGQEGRSKLLVTARDMTIPPIGISGGVHSLREAVGELEMAVPGEFAIFSSQISVCEDAESCLGMAPPQEPLCKLHIAFSLHFAQALSYPGIFLKVMLLLALCSRLVP